MEITITVEHKVDLDEDFTSMYADFLVSQDCLAYFTAANKNRFDTVDDIVVNLAEYTRALSDSREVPNYLAFYVLEDNNLPHSDPVLNQQLAEKLEELFLEWTEEVSFTDFAEDLLQGLDVQSMLRSGFRNPNRKGFFNFQFGMKNTFKQKQR